MMLHLQENSLRHLLDHNEIVGPPRIGPKRFWTGREQKILRDTYPVGGVPACLPLLPGRSAAAIYNRAGQLKLQSPAFAKLGGKRDRWISTEHIDALIRRTYEAAPTKGAIIKLSDVIARPRWWVSKRAQHLGLVLPRFKALPWTPAENEIIAERATQDPASIRRVLKRLGFVRSETAIVVQLKRLSISRVDPDNMSARSFGELMGVDVKTVTRWIDKGWLHAKGGDPYKITRPAARVFIGDNAAAVDLRKVDKEWFIDLLLERAPASQRLNAEKPTLFAMEGVAA